MRKVFLFLLTGVMLSLLVIGCRGIQMDMDTIFEEGYWDKVEHIVKSDDLKIGMRKKDVIEIMGQPSLQEKEPTAYGIHEEWIYKPSKNKYYNDSSWWVHLFFEDDKLTNIQKPNNF